MKIGKYFVVPLYEGRILRDGGVSFGCIPRVQWSRLAAPDENNLIPFSLGLFLVQGHGKNMLIDCGLGDKLSDEVEVQEGISRAARIDGLLETVGLDRSAIDIVVMTHLHFASAGGLTRIGEEGALEPTFPRARVVIQQGEWENGIHANLRTRGLYNKENYEALLWHQQLELIDGDLQLLPGLWVHMTGGHTEHHQIVVIDSENEGGIFFGDLVPSLWHLPLNVVSALDLMPLVTMEKKAEWLARAAHNQWVCFFSHDAQVAAAMLSGSVRAPGGLGSEVLLQHPA
ncbi:MAG: MBL fold metallo-hydrolase [Planctomycetes bacterium]|nr:MBL fold metallo-hydrolase [Planctomycetota bacterium]